MSRKGRLKHEFLTELKKEIKYGESKHAAKQLAREEASKNHEAFQQVKGIYSSKTYDSYRKSLNTYAEWVCRNHSEVKNMAQAKQYVHEYVDELRDRGLSEWSVHMYVYSLASAYKCSPAELNITLKQRSRADVVRNRESADSPMRNNARYENTIKLAKATGARRMELLRLRPSDFRQQVDKLGNPTGELEVFKRGKNGIERWCIVNPSYKDFVLDYLKSVEPIVVDGESRLLKKSDLPSSLSVHDLRADYAADLYNYYQQQGRGTGEMYHCRKELKGCHFDKGILHLVSDALLHTRTNVVISYLWKI